MSPLSKLFYFLRLYFVISQDVAVMRWDQCPNLVPQTDGVAVSLDLEDTSAIDVCLQVIMDSRIANVSGRI